MLSPTPTPTTIKHSAAVVVTPESVGLELPSVAVEWTLCVGVVVSAPEIAIIDPAQESVNPLQV